MSSVTVPSSEGRVAIWVARSLGVLAMVLAATAVALPLATGLGYLDELMQTPEVVVAVSFSATGVLLVQNRRASRIGWLLLAIGMFSACYTVAASYVVMELGGTVSGAMPESADLATFAAWVTGWAWFPSWLLVSTVLPQVVPYGRPLPGWWRAVHGLSYAVLIAGLLAFAVAPGPVGIVEDVPNPVGIPALDPLITPLGEALDALVPVLILLSLASVVVRVVRADPAERRQVGWFGYSVAMAVVVILFGSSLLINVAVLFVPAGIAVAALRYRLYDLDLLVNRTLVVALLLGGAALVYVALVGWVGALVGSSTGWVPFLAAFGVALLFHPARIRLQRWVDRLFHGLRGDPYALLRDLDRTLREADTPREALADAAALVRTGLRLPGVGLRVPLPGGGEVQEQAGSLPGEPTRIALSLHGQEVGELLVAPRDPRQRLPEADHRVLQLLAGPVASAAYALRLSSDLEESHGRLLAAREDERRRLRRDLHDGLGPQLAGVVMGLDVVRSSLSRGDTDRASDLALRTAEQARTAVDDVRRLVAGLRPPVLDDLGLLGALRSAGPVAAEAGPEVRFEVEGDLETLPAAVEVAAFRIVSEAITNAVRHSGARSVDVHLAAHDGELVVRVEDDGAGIAADVRRGVGLSSMRERATELGGWCTVTPGVRGTSVQARLPLLRAPAEPV